jgi:hypothetical protein
MFMKALIATHSAGFARRSVKALPVEHGVAAITGTLSEAERKGPSRETSQSQPVENEGSTSVQQFPFRWADVFRDPLAWRNLRAVVVEDEEDPAA